MILVGTYAKRLSTLNPLNKGMSSSATGTRSEISHSQMSFTSNFG